MQGDSTPSRRKDRLLSENGPGRRAVAYLRVSTQLQADEGFGLDVQRDRVTTYAAEHGLELLDVVTEAASGGVRDGEEFSWEHRPVLLALMERAEAGGFEVLLLPRYDRLSRDHVSLVVLERRFQRHAVEIVSVAEEHNGDGPIGEFIRGQLALVAQLERAMIRDRLTAGKMKARQQGRHTEGGHPYGYHAPSRRGLLEPDPERADIVRRIFLEARDGRSTGRIAQALNRDGIPSPRGKLWTRPAVHGILTNPVYIVRGSRGRRAPGPRIEIRGSG